MSILSIGLQQGIEQGLQQGIEQGLQQGIEQGLQQGIEQGIEQGISETLVKNIESAMKNFGLDLQEACKGLGTTIEEYENARKKIELFKENKSCNIEHLEDEDDNEDGDIEMGQGLFFP